MSVDGGWPADPSDPRCPECDGPVSATSPFCMHCEADLPPGDPGSGTARAASGTSTGRIGVAGGDDDATSLLSSLVTAVRSSTSTTRSAPSEPSSGTNPNAPSSTTPDVTTSTTPDAPSSSGTGDAWLDPDGILDDVSTVGVGVVAGLLAGAIASATLLFALPDLWPFLAGLAVWAGATAWIARTRTVFGAVRKAGYLVGALLAVAPLLFVATAPFAEDTLGQRLTGVLVFGIFAWPVGLVAAGVGWLAGHGRPDRDE